MIKEALFFESLDDDLVVCHLCPADCRLKEGQRGICHSRFNQDGKLVTDNFGELVSLAVDPIEKKPLYHFYPGSMILSTGANCCNLGCLHCQNWSVSQERAKTVFFTPERLLESVFEHDSIGVAFTYTEPIIWYEYIIAVAPLLKEVGLKVVLVSNGYINAEPLEKLLEFVDAFNIDLKAMRPEFYSHICKAKLQPVLETIEKIAATDIHLELTNLIIPTQNDSIDDFNSLTDFVANLSPNIPLHLSSYHPEYKMDIPVTPADTLLAAYRIATEKLNYVYPGNVKLENVSDTRCPNCKALLIKRDGYRIKKIGLSDSNCAQCGAASGIVC